MELAEGKSNEPEDLRIFRSIRARAEQIAHEEAGKEGKKGKKGGN